MNQRTGNIIDGHARVELAEARKEPTIPVVYVDLDVEEEALVLATFDPLSAMATTDKEKLNALFAQLASSERLVEVLGHFRALPHVGLTDPDQVPDPPAEALTKAGDLWLLGHHRLLCGDSTNTEDVARLMAGERATLFATDPPYLVDYDGMGHPHAWNQKEKNKDWTGMYAVKWDESRQSRQLYDDFVSAAKQEAIAPDAAWYCWHAGVRSGMVQAVWEDAGAFVHQQIIWVKDRPIITRSWYMWQHEPCFFGWMRGKKPKNRVKDFPRTVWEIPTVSAGAKTDHPTSKPVRLFEIPIEQHTSPGGLCYEPFSGSGSQLVAAERLGRRCYAMEIEPRYVDVAVRRWEEFTGEKAVLAE